MNWVDGRQVFSEYLSDKLHEGTQVESTSVSLTAGSFYQPAGAGELDFGGSEFQLGDRSEVSAEKRNSDDDYGWWDLSGGQWIMELNETITYTDPFDALLQPHQHLTWNGATHPTLRLTEDDADMRLLVPLTVPAPGLKVKENARVTTIRVRRPD